MRDQGIQALRDGDLDRAIDFLARAVMADERDGEAKSYLGLAYGRKGLYAQARRAIESAVQLQPQNADFRCRLGALLEMSGDKMAAAAAYRDALQLQPEHAQARARLELLGAAVTPAAEPPALAAAEAQSPLAAPSPLGAVPGAAAAPAAQPRPGTVHCVRCGEWSRPGRSCEWCSAQLAPPPPAAPPPGYGPAPPPPPPAYAAPPAAPGYPAAGYAPAPGYPAQQYGYGPPGYPMPGFTYKKPHRGVLILVLGICAWALCAVCGIVAWVLANQDLAEMDSGLMDESGRGMTVAGRIISIIILALTAAGILFYIAFFALVIGAGGFR